MCVCVFRQEQRSGLPFPTPGHLPVPGIKPTASPESSALADGFFTVPSGKPLTSLALCTNWTYMGVLDEELIHM